MFKYFDWFFCLILVVILIYCMWIYLKQVNYMNQNIFWVKMENRKWFFISEDIKKVIDIYLNIKFLVSEKDFFFWLFKIYSLCLFEVVFL